MGSTFDVDTWLGVSVLGPAGKEIALGPEIAAALKAAAVDGTLTELDVPDEGVSMDDAQFKDFEEAMAAILSTGATAAKSTMRPVDTSRFKLYLKGRYKDGKVSSSSKAKEPELTEALKADLAAQGMSSWRDLAFLELSIFLGRPAGSAECIGFAHYSPPTHMDGAKVAKKNGAMNFDLVLAAAMESGDLTRANSWMMTLAQRCASSPASPFAGAAANQMNTWWSKAQRLGNARATAWYAVEYRQAKMGRGLPLDSDPELLALASNQRFNAPTIVDLTKGVGKDVDVASTASGYSSLPSGASGLGSELSTQFEKVHASTALIAESVAELAGRVSRIESAGPAGGGWSSAEGGAREHPPGSCFICHSTEHRIHNCPKLPQDIKRAIKESKKKKDSEDA